MFQANSRINNGSAPNREGVKLGKDSLPRVHHSVQWHTPPFRGVCIALGESAAKNSLHWTIALLGGFGVIYRVKTAH